MIRSLLILASVSSIDVLGNPLRARREVDVSDYCSRHASHYSRYCGAITDFDRDTRAKLYKFCPAYEANCGSGLAFRESGSSPSGGFVVPPPLPKSSDFKFDIPIGHQSKPRPSPKERLEHPMKASELTPEIVATCTPDCTAMHCTTACKCAYTHPKVHSMCNPPATADLAATCTKWYSKCPMFQPLAYD